jgi:hypothetical protein
LKKESPRETLTPSDTDDYALHGAALELQVDFAGQRAQSNPKAEVRIAYIEATQALSQVRKQTSDLTDELNGLLDLPAGTELELVELMPPAVRVISADEAVQYALHSNPQVGEAQANIEKAQGALRIARADFLPDVNIFGSYFTVIQAIVGGRRSRWPCSQTPTWLSFLPTKSNQGRSGLNDDQIYGLAARSGWLRAVPSATVGARHRS